MNASEALGWNAFFEDNVSVLRVPDCDELAGIVFETGITGRIAKGSSIRSALSDWSVSAVESLWLAQPVTKAVKMIAAKAMTGCKGFIVDLLCLSRPDATENYSADGVFRISDHYGALRSVPGRTTPREDCHREIGIRP
ncbi:MAG: hypothetical protein ACREJU_20250 [Nitrospiraceae bacterium]